MKTPSDVSSQMTRTIAIAFTLAVSFALPAAAVDAHHEPVAKAAAGSTK